MSLKSLKQKHEQLITCIHQKENSIKHFSEFIENNQFEANVINNTINRLKSQKNECQETLSKIILDIRTIEKNISSENNLKRNLLFTNIDSKYVPKGTSKFKFKNSPCVEGSTLYKHPPRLRIL
jgi:chromosome segregation ATPase